MKTNIFSSLFAFALLCGSLTSCINDDSNYIGVDVPNIEVSGIEDNYEAVSFVGQHLKINPVVNTGYKDVKYEWYLCSKQTGQTTASGDTIQPVLIGTEKNLDYEVNIAPAQYQLRLKCIAENGFVNTIATYLSVVTEFSKGFYILKETADGNSDLDLFTLNGKMNSNLISAVHGKPLSGAPLMLNIAYEGYYINEETNQMEYTNKVVVTTESGDFASYRCTDLKKLFDRSNIKFDEMGPDEKVITIYNSEMYELLLTNKGSYGITVNSPYFKPNSGRYPLPSEGCFGAHFIPDFMKAMGSGVFWDEKDCSIKSYSNGGIVEPVANKKYEPVPELTNLTGTKCLYAGICNGAGKSFMLLEGPDGKRKIVYFKGTYIRAIYGYISAYENTVDIPTTGHLANASIFASSGMQAPYIYIVDGNKLYGANVNSDELPEVPIPLEGIGSSEKITYISNQYDAWTMNAYDYLIVGTESGDSYNLYFYECSNGIPTGQPVMKTSGKGKVKGVRFLTDTYDSYSYRSVTD